MTGWPPFIQITQRTRAFLEMVYDITITDAGDCIPREPFKPQEDKMPENANHTTSSQYILTGIINLMKVQLESLDTAAIAAHRNGEKDRARELSDIASRVSGAINILEKP